MDKRLADLLVTLLWHRQEPSPDDEFEHFWVDHTGSWVVTYGPRDRQPDETLYSIGEVTDAVPLTMGTDDPDAIVAWLLTNDPDYYDEVDEDDDVPIAGDVPASQIDRYGDGWQ